MARYSISHTCGHAEEHDVTGSRATRDAQVARLRGSSCSRCYRQEQTEAAAEESEQRGWPSLKGSHEDVSWALVLRSKRVKELEARAKEEYIAVSAQKLGHTPSEAEQARIEARASAALPRMLAKAGQHLLERDDAAWWIKTRRLPLLKVLAEGAIEGADGGMDNNDRS